LGLNWKEKLKFRANLIKNKRIKGPRTKIENTLKFRDSDNLIKGVIEEKNRD
jgi:hypothetical protein